MATIGNLVVKLGLDAANLEKGLQNAQRTLRNAGRTMKDIGAGLTFGVSAPLAGIATMALSSAADFETSMNTIQVVAGATDRQMAALQKQALHLGAVTSFSAGEAAQAMLELAKAGLSVTQIQDAVPGVLNLAAAGNLSLARSAEITANTLNAYSLAASQANTISNGLAAAANASSVDVTDLADALKMAGTVAAQNKISFQDTITALAILGNNALKGSDAGTSLKTMIMRLVAPTDAAKKQMDALGISIYDAQGAIRPFPDILANLQKAFGGLDDATRNAAMANIFGADAIRAASILIANAGDAWNNMNAAVNKTGAASEIANARMKGLGGAIEYFKGSIDSFLIGAALPFTETLGNFIRSAADLISGIANLPPHIQRFGAILLFVVAAGGPLLVTLGVMTTALAGLLSPIGLLVAGLALLAAAFAANFAGLRDGAITLLESLQPTFAAITDWLSAQIPTAVAATQSAWQNLAAGLAAAWSTLLSFLEPAFTRIQAAFAEIPSQLGPLQTAFDNLVAAFANTFAALQPLLTLLAQIIAATFAGVALFALNTFAAVLNAVLPAAAILINQLAVVINLLATVLSNLVTLVVALFTGDWQTAFQSAHNIGLAFVEAFTATLNNLAALVNTIMLAISGAILNTLADLGLNVPELLNTLAAAWSTIWNGLAAPVDAIKTAVDAVRTALESFTAWVATLTIPNPFAGWSFPSLPSLPSWPGSQPGRNAFGTPNWPGGWTLVGERGPELINLRGGAAIHPLPLAANAGGNLIIEAVHIHNDMDIEELAYRIFQIRQRRTTR